MKPLRIAVVGGGHLGRIHARLLGELEQAELVAVVEPDPQAQAQVAKQCAAPIHDHLGQLPAQLDAAIVATPTSTHHQVARQLLAAGVHLLVEKPLTFHLNEAQELVEIASRNNLVLQVGHVERFNPAFVSASAALQRHPTPSLITARRTSGYPMRSTDIGVVHDLMIHDLELCLALAGAPVTQVEALGWPVVGPREDFAQARLRFANGLVAELVASRVSSVVQRKMEVFTSHGAVEIDFAAPVARETRHSAELLAGAYRVDELSPERARHLRECFFTELSPQRELPLRTVNAILEEQRDLLESILHKRSPHVAGSQGRDAVAVAETICHQIDQQQRRQQIRVA